MSHSIELSGTVIVRLTVREPHSLSEPVLKELLRILTTEIAPEARLLILANSHPEALLADVAGLKDLSPQQAIAFSELGQRVCAALEALPFPVLAAIDGMALGGGCELTLACDLVYASDQSRFGQIEVLGGILPGFGGTWRLPRRVGQMKARELMFTGTILNAHSAKSAGLVTEVVSQADLPHRVSKVAETLAAGAPLAIRGLKTLLQANREAPLAASNLLERQIFASLFGTADQKEGMTAFLEKRTPTFKGA
jgi:enoyl-CoA hydratase